MQDSEKIRLLCHLCESQGDAVALVMAARALARVRAKAIGEVIAKIERSQVSDVSEELSAKDRRALAGVDLAAAHELFTGMRSAAEILCRFGEEEEREQREARARKAASAAQPAGGAAGAEDAKD